MTAPYTSAPQLTLVLSQWLADLLVDPLSKDPFVETGLRHYRSPCGFEYRVHQGIPDLRACIARSSSSWLAGQTAFELWAKHYFERGERDPGQYSAEVELLERIYGEFSLAGRVLDVGGQIGTLRRYLAPEQQYCSLDPSRAVFETIRNRPQLLAHFPIAGPLDFIHAYAEFLPLRSKAFDVVNMRECLDHFANPQLALLEAFRVLRCGGRLVIGVLIEERKKMARFKTFVRPCLSRLVPGAKDHHLWHPTHGEVVDLCTATGFEFEHEVWAPGGMLYCSFVRTAACPISD